jgi:trk system potassium uptake protein TrkH
MVFYKIAYRPVFFIVGVFLLILAGTMLIPAGVDFFSDDPNAQSFMSSCFICAFAGGICVLAYRCEGELELRIREAFFLTSCAWIAIALFASLPFVLSRAVPCVSDGILEAVSALTTTGFSILESVDTAPYSLLLWRSILQWLGGLGIMMMALTLLPFLKIGGRQLFYTEFSERSEKILPRLSQMTQAILGVYLLMTLSCVGLLWWGGLSLFDAVCHGLSTVSTGGLSTSGEGVEHFHLPGIKWIMTFFMVLAASPLLLVVRMFTGDWGAYFQDSQVRAYLMLLGTSCCCVLLWQWLHKPTDFWKLLEQSIFQVTSTLTTTGFQTQETWHPVLQMLFTLLTFVGGCTGSTAGGIKIFRFQMMYRVLRSQVYQLLHPHGVFIPVYGKRNVNEQVIASVFSFVAVYIVSFATLCVGFVICGLSPESSFSLCLNILSNTGNGTLSLSAFTVYPLMGRWLTILGMFLGRLEFFTLLLIVMRPFWRR